MQMYKNRSIELQITSYLAGECSPAEKQVIAGLIQSDLKYRTAYLALKQIWDNPVLRPVSDTYNIDGAWLNVSRHISDTHLSVVHNGNVKRAIGSRMLRFAAGIAAVLLIAFTVFNITRDNNVMKRFASGTEVSSPIALSDGSHIVLNSGSELNFPEKFGAIKHLKVEIW